MKNLGFFLLAIGVLACETSEDIKIISKPVPITNTTERAWNEGWIAVPENRTERTSNSIQLPFILSKVSDNKKIEKPPILIMSGGPGNSSLHMANGVVNTPWGQNNNILVLEQRGTMYANPPLLCPEIDSLRILGLKNGLWGASLDSLKLQGSRICFERLITQNADLNGYNSIESVEDIEALRRALDIDQLILYGMSYSCNLMATYAQTYPQHTKALILDSPLPHHVNYDEDAYQNIDSILKNVVVRYSGSKRLYDRWKGYITNIKDSIFQVSINSKVYRYTKNELIDIILFKMSDHRSLPETTQSIQNILDGNHEEITDVINYYLTPTRQALGMRYSLWVGEELPEENESIIEEQRDLYSWLHDYPVNDVSFETGKVWEVTSFYENKEWPRLTYQGPALILSGQFDPWTPEWYGSIMLKYLPNGRHIIYPELSHLPGFTAKGFTTVNEFISQIE